MDNYVLCNHSVHILLRPRQMINTTTVRTTFSCFSGSFQYPIMGCHSPYDLLASSHLHSVTQAGLVSVVVVDKMHIREIIELQDIIALR
jgi:hypothetical protein